MGDQTTERSPIELAVDIVAAFVSKNHVGAKDLTGLLEQVYCTLVALDRPMEPQNAAKAPQPAVPIRNAASPKNVTCLDCGRIFQSLRRHLGQHGMTPDQYRAKWGLPFDYPMVAQNYATRRSDLAKKMGLGRRSR